MSERKTALVLSAHAADFVWRCGGAIALHAEMGYDVTIACMSFGERGESARLWKRARPWTRSRRSAGAKPKPPQRRLARHGWNASTWATTRWN